MTIPTISEAIAQMRALQGDDLGMCRHYNSLPQHMRDDPVLWDYITGHVRGWRHVRSLEQADFSGMPTVWHLFRHDHVLPGHLPHKMLRSQALHDAPQAIGEMMNWGFFDSSGEWSVDDPIFKGWTVVWLPTSEFTKAHKVAADAVEDLTHLAVQGARTKRLVEEAPWMSGKTEGQVHMLMSLCIGAGIKALLSHRFESSGIEIVTEHWHSHLRVEDALGDEDFDWLEKNWPMGWYKVGSHRPAPRHNVYLSTLIRHTFFPLIDPLIVFDAAAEKMLQALEDGVVYGTVFRTHGGSGYQLLSTSLPAASNAWALWRGQAMVGASQMATGAGEVFQLLPRPATEPVARISYNGRIWMPDGSEYNASADLLPEKAKRHLDVVRLRVKVSHLKREALTRGTSQSLRRVLDQLVSRLAQMEARR